MIILDYYFNNKKILWDITGTNGTLTQDLRLLIKGLI